MRYISKIKIFAALVTFFFALGACTEDFEKMNTTPNNPTDVPAITIFTHAIDAAVNDKLGSGWVNHTYLACWSQQWAKIQYIDEDKYLSRVENINAFYEAPYINELKDLEIVINKCKAGGTEVNPGLEAAARILRAWVYAQQTDNFGDIPYTEALKGDEIGAGVFPKYDTQESIYMDLLKQLNDANNLLATPGLNPLGTGDLIYGGEHANWKKFANSLRLRLLNRCSGVYAQADAIMAEMLADPAKYPVFTSNGNDAELAYPGVLPYRNGTYNTLYTRTDQGISQTMVNWLKDRNDSRLAVFAQPISATKVSKPDGTTVDAPDPTYIGQQNGAAATPTISQRSFLGEAIAYDPAAPAYVMTYAELQFIIAEHYKRKGNDAKAKEAYEKGITASFDQWGAGMPEGYLAHAKVAWDGGVDQYKLIAEQKWAAIFGNGTEAYAEVRRTGYPSRIFEYELEATNYPGKGIPIRFPYPANEESYNAANLKEAKARQSISANNDGMFDSKMWWMTKTLPVPTAKDPQKAWLEVSAAK